MEPSETRIHLGVAESTRCREPPPLPLARRHDARSHGLRSLRAGPVRNQLEWSRGVQLADDVDPIDERAAQAARIAGTCDVIALTIALRARARARVACADEHDRGGEPDRSLTSHYLDPPFLERLTQRL